jgi:hypothetical protein
MSITPYMANYPKNTLMNGKNMMTPMAGANIN